MIPELQLNTSGYYQIAQSAQMCWPFEITRGTAYKFTHAHTQWAQNQSFSIRFWVSKTPGGISVHGWPQGSWRTVTAQRSAQSFVIYDGLQSNWQFTDVTFAWSVVRDNTYYLNVQNLENKSNAYYLMPEQILRDTPE